MRGRRGTMTHDYKRHGTTTLFAALNVLDGKVIGQGMSRHRHQEFIRFLNRINRETPVGREVHLIVDNYATHKHPKVRAWRGRHTRFHCSPGLSIIRGNSRPRDRCELRQPNEPLPRHAGVVVGARSKPFECRQHVRV